MKPSDAVRVTTIIEAIAAEEMLPRFRCLGVGDVREKGPGDLVTVVDEACEARLAQALTALLPGSIVVGEEDATRDPRVLEQLSGEAPVWIIDPLDGTYNFAHGVDRFATIVALARYGETVAGWIHDPVNGVTAMGEAGAGAFIGSRRLRAAGAAPLAAMTGAFSRPRYARSGPMRGIIDRLAKAVGRHISLGSAGIEYLWLADGRAHIGLGGIFGKLRPWDHAAGVLLHKEAGGFSAMLDGTPYTPAVLSGGLLAAPDPACWRAVRDLLSEQAA